MNMNSMRKKVAIIGSGLGGLSCGYILQRNGFDVTIFDGGRRIRRWLMVTDGSYLR